MGDRAGRYLEALLDEVRLLFHQAATTVEELHSGQMVSAGMRSVLEQLARHGPASVPDIARRRLVTRQHIQELVNALVARGLVVSHDNPAHRRSPLFDLTSEGQRTISRMSEREQRFLARLDTGRTAEEIRQTAAVLAAVRQAMGQRP
jgi:DNA-binding MarR family transcriptional regulator